MAILNRATWQQEHQDMTDRNPPFDGDPLIQKADTQTVVGDDLGDSTIFRDGDDQSINSPWETFSIDFTNGDQVNIDSNGSGNSVFTVTLAGLNSNEFGLLNVSKKLGDTFTFANGDYVAVPDTRGQDGKTEIKFLIKRIEPTVTIQEYSVIPLYDYHDVILLGTSISGDLVGTWPNYELGNAVVAIENMQNNSVGSDQIISNSVGEDEIIDDSISSSKLQNNSVGNVALANNSITEPKIVDQSIPFDKVQNDIPKHGGLAVRDLNTTIEPGVYGVASGSSNTPGGGVLIFGNVTVTRLILSPLTFGDDIIQTLVYIDAPSDRKIAIRNSTDGGSTWSSWFN